MSILYMENPPSGHLTSDDDINLVKTKKNCGGVSLYLRHTDKNNIKTTCKKKKYLTNVEINLVHLLQHAYSNLKTNGFYIRGEMR